MTGALSRRRGVAGFGIFTLAMVACLVGLGIWQLQRRVEKHALIAALTERLAAAPGALPPPAQWRALTPARDEFRRVEFHRDLRKHFRMRWSTAPARPCATIFPVPAPGRSCRRGLPTGEMVVINAGFVQNTMQDRAHQDRAVGRLVTGAAGEADWLSPLSRKRRHADAGGKFAKRLWFTRDHLAMARALGWGEGGQPVAPFYIDLESPVPESGMPKPGPLTVHLKDDHLQYAITWFALAGAVVIAFGVWMRGQRRVEVAARKL